MLFRALCTEARLYPWATARNQPSGSRARSFGVAFETPSVFAKLKDSE